VYDLVAEAGSSEDNGVRARHGRRYGDFCRVLAAVAGKPVHVGFDGGRLTSDGGVLLLAAIEQRLKNCRASGRLPRGPARPGAGAARACREWCERQRVGYILGLSGNPVLLRQVGPLAEDAALGRLAGEGEKVRRWGDFRYAAKSWTVARRVIARVEASPQGADTRFIVTNLPGLPKALYEKIYCARGQAENLIKAHKLHLASDRTSCRKATANQFRLLIHTAAYCWCGRPRRHRVCQNEVVADLRQRRPSVEQISRIGMDTSKHIFQLHGVNTAEEPVLRKKLRRKEMVAFFEKLQPMVIAIEACGGSHHWARLLQSFGHEVKLIAPQYVKPFVKRGKNDAADAEALCEAMSRPAMRFVPVKTLDNQAARMLVGLRDRLIRNRVQLANAIRGYAAEFGLTAAKGMCKIAPLLDRAAADETLPALARELFAFHAAEYAQLQEQLKKVETISAAARRRFNTCLLRWKSAGVS
jgi:hypothetical protein